MPLALGYFRDTFCTVSYRFFTKFNLSHRLDATPVRDSRETQESTGETPAPPLMGQLTFPVLDLLVIFVAGNFGNRRGELDRAGFAFDLAAQALRQIVELRGGKVGDIARV